MFILETPLNAIDPCGAGKEKKAFLSTLKASRVITQHIIQLQKLVQFPNPM